jgi:hypothetical protein
MNPRSKKTLIVVGVLATLVVSAVGITAAVAANRDKPQPKPGQALKSWASCLREQGVKVPSLADLQAGRLDLDLGALERARKECGSVEKAVRKDLGSLRQSAEAFRRCLREEGVDRESLLGSLLRGLPAQDVERLSDGYAACRSQLPLLPALGG